MTAMTRRFAALALSLMLAGAGPSAQEAPQASSSPRPRVTSCVEVYPDKAPKTVENFLQYVKDKHYDGTVFHRVIDGFMIQGGGFDAEVHREAHAAHRCARRPRSAGQGRPQERRGHAGDGAHQRPEFGHLAVLHQREGQRFPRPHRHSAGRSGAALRIPGPCLSKRRALAAGERAPVVRLHRVRQGRQRHGCGRQDQGRAHRAGAKARAFQRRAQNARHHQSATDRPSKAKAAP